MKKIILLIILLGYTSILAELKIEYPQNQQKICYENGINIKWNNSNPINNYTLSIKVDNSNYKIIANNLSKDDKEFRWNIDDTQFFDKNLTLLISDGVSIDSTEFIISKIPTIDYITPSDILCSGSPFEIKIEASGTNLKYQWYKDNSIIPNYNSPVLIFDSVGFEHSGIYHCIIKSDFCKEISSQFISLYVVSETQITEQPKTMQFINGSNTTFKLQAHQIANSKSIEPQFRWYRDSLDQKATTENYKKLGIDPKDYPNDSLKKYFVYRQVPLWDGIKYQGAFTNELTVKKVNYSDKVNYQCKVIGKCGTVLSDYVTLGSDTHFEIKKLSGDYIDCSGGDAKFIVRVTQFYPGTITYKWYKGGMKSLAEGDKYIGTNTPTLTIKNVQRSDNQIYYCLVTLKEYGISQQSPFFIAECEYKPNIVYQTKFFKILDPGSLYFGALNMEVRISNNNPCIFEWYKDGKKVLTDFQSGVSVYKKTLDAFVQGKPDDEGIYVVRIQNHCGETWSDTIICVYGDAPVRLCAGNQAVIRVEDNTPDKSQYYYSWRKAGKTLQEGEKYINTKKNTLFVNNIAYPADEGIYELWGVYYSSGKSFWIGTSMLFVAPKPYMAKDLPDSLIYISSTIPKTTFSVFSKSSEISYQVFLNDNPIGAPLKVKASSLDQSYFPFYFGSNDFYAGDGIYQFHFKDSCGEVWSKKMDVRKYKKSIQIDEDNFDIPKIIAGLNNETVQIKLFPNPVIDVLNIQISEFNDSGISISTINQLGEEYILINNNSNVTNYQIPTSELYSGFNIIKIKINGSIYLYKVMVE